MLYTLRNHSTEYASQDNPKRNFGNKAAQGQASQTVLFKTHWYWGGGGGGGAAQPAGKKRKGQPGDKMHCHFSMADTTIGRVREARRTARNNFKYSSELTFKCQRSLEPIRLH